MCNTRQPNSLRTRLAGQAYLAGFQGCSGWVSSFGLYQRAKCYAAQTLSPTQATWATLLIINAFRQGWHDAARHKPCQPWPDCKSEGQS
jgi:hypothetical protein